MKPFHQAHVEKLAKVALEDTIKPNRRAMLENQTHVRLTVREFANIAYLLELVATLPE